MYKQEFVIEGFDGVFEGYTNGERWNGWSCPRFPKEVADKVVDMFNRGVNCKAWYDEENDEYIFTQNHDNIEDEKYDSQLIEIDGKEIKVYAIGAWGWVWEDYTQD